MLRQPVQGAGPQPLQQSRPLHCCLLLVVAQGELLEVQALLTAQVQALMWTLLPKPVQRPLPLRPQLPCLPLRACAAALHWVPGPGLQQLQVEPQAQVLVAAWEAG